MNKTDKIVINLIEKHSRLLDLGCGDGRLLSVIKDKKKITGYGIEKNIENIKNCIEKGHDVYQGNIENCLPEFSNNAYDTIILSETLQEINHPMNVIKEMQRIAKRIIIIIPNFAFYTARIQLLTGSAPKTKQLPYSWYNTPNIRAITIKDFKEFCKKNSLTISKEIHIYESNLLEKIMPASLGNVFCKKALFVIEHE